jgi:K+:H+ antiporter
MQAPPAQVMLGFAAVLLVGAALAPLFRRLRQPVVVAEIAAGIVLGPSLLGLLPGHLSARLFPSGVQSGLSDIAQVGILLFMFLIGWETNFAPVRSRRKEVFSVSLASITLPLACGASFAMLLYHDHSVVKGKHVSEPAFLLFVGAAMAVTAFPVLARIIAEHRLQLTPPGILGMASAAVGDVIAWCLLALVSVLAAGAGSGRLLRLAGWCVLYTVVLAFVVRPAVRWLIAWLSPDGVVSPLLLGLLAAGAFTAGYVTQQMGLDSIFGAFTFGLIMPRESLRQLRSAVHAPAEKITGFLLPVFFISSGLAVNVRQLGGAGLLEMLGIIAVACFGKLAGASVAARLAGLSPRDSLTVGLLMNTRGLTELIILNAGKNMGILDTRLFTMMVVMALLTTAMTGPLLPRRPYARPAILPERDVIEANSSQVEQFTASFIDVPPA